jgi:hypothetical protein
VLRRNNNPATFLNPRTGDVWVCDDLNQKRNVDGVDFIEVRKPENQRKVWINLSNLVKLKNLIQNKA